MRERKHTAHRKPSARVVTYFCLPVTRRGHAMRPTLAYAVPLELRRFYGLRASSPSFHAPPDLRPAPPSAARTSPPPTRSTRSAGSAPRAPAVRVRVRVRVTVGARQDTCREPASVAGFLAPMMRRPFGIPVSRSPISMDPLGTRPSPRASTCRPSCVRVTRERSAVRRTDPGRRVARVRAVTKSLFLPQPSP